MRSKRDLGNCVICGKRKAVGRDHIPPKGIFTPPRPSNLITVPACDECNMGSSGLDERFRVNLGMHIERTGDSTAKAFHEATLRTLEHNHKLRREILSKLEPVYLTTPSGIIYDRASRALWDSEAHDAVVERMIRGLYYHHFGEILGDHVEVKVHWYPKLTKEMVGMSKGWRRNRFGKGEVTYRFARGQNLPLDSLWIFQFYKAHWAGGYTKSKHPAPRN